MNTVVTSREAILEECRKMAMENGFSSVNMRGVAKACGVAVGSIYYYFPSKEALIIAAIEDGWKRIFHGEEFCRNYPEQFGETVEYIFVNASKELKRYPGFFSTHMMGLANAEKERGRGIMEQYFVHMKQGLLSVLENDKRANTKVFQGDFTKEVFVEFVFSNLMQFLTERKESCSVLLKVIESIIYPESG